MKLVPKLIIIGACCWAADVYAQVNCNVAPGPIGGGLVSGGASPMTKGPCGPTSPPPPPAQGLTPADIDANFPAYVIWQFRWADIGGMDQTITTMTDKEIYILASFFIQNNGDQSTLQQIAAQTLNATNLVRWQAAFTQAIVSPYVGAYAPTPISTKYFSHPGLRSIVHAPAASPPPPPDPFANYNRNLQELYLEWRTAPDKSCSVTCALAKLAKFAMADVYFAWRTGQEIGTTFYNAMTAIDPSYGWDLMTQGGDIMAGNGMITPWQTGGNSGEGFVEDPDGTWHDGNGNVVPDPNPTTYGIPQNPDYYPPYTFYDPYGDCLIGFLCAGEYPD